MHVGLEVVLLCGIGEDDAARALHPAAVVDAGARPVLQAALRIGIPHAVEEHDHRPDVVLGGDLEKLVDALEEAVAILVPGKVVQENANRVEADRLGPAELAVDRLGIERVGLPHFELVDRRAGEEVAADEPGLGVVPLVGLVRRPAIGGVGELGSQ